MSGEPERYWKSPWGFNDEDPPPPREEFFPEIDDSGAWYAAQLVMEDFLQHNCVFYNLLNGRTCHSDSYMTGVAYGNLDYALKLLQDTYSPTNEEMHRHAKQWVDGANTQPPLRGVGMLIQRRFPVPQPALEDVDGETACDLCGKRFDPRNTSHDVVADRWVCCSHAWTPEELAEKMGLPIVRVYEDLGLEMAADNQQEEASCA